MRSDERRRHVRIRPLPELPARLHRIGAPDAELAIYDVSIGGLGLVTDESLRSMKRDERLSIHLDLGRYGGFDLVIVLKHIGQTLTGAEIDSPPYGLTSAMGRYIAELLERGALS